MLTGGFKLWECAVDLAGHLCQQYHISNSPGAASMCTSSPPLSGSSVLELGCGQGLPGILLLLCGARVHFQVCLNTIGLVQTERHTIDHQRVCACVRPGLQ